ncbi:ras suppressor protein 1 [Aphomia sociella]
MSHQPPVSCIPNTAKMSKAKKVIEEAREINNPEIDLVDKGISNLEEIPGLFNLANITRLSLSHNKIQTVPAALANLMNLEILNFANNQIEELPVSLSSLPKLRILNVSLNRLYGLPRGFGAFPVLEILDLTYNNLNEKTLPGNFCMMESLRALYLGDNDFEYLPPEIGNLKNLQILSLRENDLIEVPRELGQLTRLRELHLQANRLVVLPPEIGTLDLASNKSVLRLEGNSWVPPIEDQINLGPSHVLDYLRSETYRVLYTRHMSAKPPPPKQTLDKSKKASRARS